MLYNAVQTVALNCDASSQILLGETYRHLQIKSIRNFSTEDEDMRDGKDR